MWKNKVVHWAKVADKLKNSMAASNEVSPLHTISPVGAILINLLHCGTYGFPSDEGFLGR